MNTFLTELLNDIEHIRKELEELTSDLSDEEIQRPPGPKSWSILSCVGHITKTGNEYLPRLKKAASDSPTIDNGDSLAYRPTWMGRIFISYISPSSARRLPAPRKFKPAPSTDRASTLGELNSQLDELSNLVRRVDGRDYNLVRFTSPVSPMIRFSLGDGLSIVVVHARRHLAQIARTRRLILDPVNGR